LLVCVDGQPWSGVELGSLLGSRAKGRYTLHFVARLRFPVTFFSFRELLICVYQLLNGGAARIRPCVLVSSYGFVARMKKWAGGIFFFLNILQSFQNQRPCCTSHILASTECSDASYRFNMSGIPLSWEHHTHYRFPRYPAHRPQSQGSCGELNREAMTIFYRGFLKAIRNLILLLLSSLFPVRFLPPYPLVVSRQVLMCLKLMQTCRRFLPLLL